ncbi:homoserine kinase [Rapidithrix thailandica]|uniref:Homoserine kinase n=1 Tax=Rapidithrix thailandica TaxID=413964 RepID=A0AAW9S793_9BACT
MEDLLTHEMNQVLSHYSIGKLITVSKIAVGYANQNYIIQTHQGKYLYRIVGLQPHNVIQYELQVLNKLKTVRFPTAYPIVKDDGEYICETSHGNVVIYEFVEGETPEIKENTAQQIGETLARLSRFPDWQQFEKKNAMNIDLCEGLIDEFAQAKHSYPEIFAFFKRETRYLFPYLEQPVPMGFVHGDIFPDKVIFKDGKLKAIVDFEEVCTDHLLVDIGIAINGFCIRQNTLDEHLLKAFLTAYNQERRISEEEFVLLPYYIEWGAFAMVYWHLRNDLLHQANRRQLARVEELVSRIKHLKGFDYSFILNFRKELAEQNA